MAKRLGKYSGGSRSCASLRLQTTGFQQKLLSKSGDLIGHLAVIHDKSLDLHTNEFSVLEVFSTRAPAELERSRTERQQREFQEGLQESQKLESLGIMAGGIAHDFNNILMVILGNTDILLREIPEDSQAYSGLKDISNAARRAADLTEQMLAYSGRGHFVVETIDVAATTEEVSGLLNSSVSKNTHLSLDFEPDLPPVLVDSSQFRQVAINLIINASSLEGREGEVTVRVRKRTMEKEDFQGSVVGEDLSSGAYVSFEVADNGCGMDKETIRKIFEPFLRRNLSGAALGLPLCLAS